MLNRPQTIGWSYADQNQWFSFQIMHLKTLFAIWRPFCFQVSIDASKKKKKKGNILPKYKKIFVYTHVHEYIYVFFSLLQHAFVAQKLLFLLLSLEEDVSCCWNMLLGIKILKQHRQQFAYFSVLIILNERKYLYFDSLKFDSQSG